ncbi:hypothetical protein [Saccharolobus shibatae]|nr:hypothetical protein [Saccharolobus shibatae]
MIGGFSVQHVNALASSSANSSILSEPLNYTLAILNESITKEYIKSLAINNYSSGGEGYTVVQEYGWLIMKSINYTFNYIGEAYSNNYTFDTILLVNSTYESGILVKNEYNVTLSNIPTSNGVDSVARIVHKYIVIRGITSSQTYQSSTTQFYWFNYTRTPVGNNEYNTTFNANVEGIKAKGYVVEDPNGNNIALLSGSINVVENSNNINAKINDNEITIYTNNSNDPVTIDPNITKITESYSWGYVKGVVITSQVPVPEVTSTASIINFVVTLLFRYVNSVIVPIVSAYIFYYLTDYENFVSIYSSNGVTTLYYMEFASHVYVNLLFWSGYIVSGLYAETGVYYNNEYYPFTNSFTLLLVPNYNLGYFLYEQPHSSLIPPSPYSPPWYALW